jgi:hypothetical protein
VVTPNFSNVFIDTNQPTFTAGHGYAETRVYGAYWTTTLPTFANSKKIFTFNGSSAAMPTASTLKLRVWLTWVSKDGTESPATGGTNGFDATSLKVSGTDLGDAVVQAVNIAAGGIDASKFASDIQPVGFTASGSPLPTVKTTELMSWQGRLYKWNSTSGAYIYTTPAGDITGQLTDGQIAAVAAAKLTGSITSTQITDGSISTPKLAAGAVTTNELAAGAVTAGKIAAGTITATQIAADTITAAQIATGAITAAEIAAGAISVGTAAIANGAIVNAHIGTAAVDSIKIADGSVVNAKIGNMIKSANFNGAINGADQIIANGTTGWAIDKYGRAVFNDIWIRQLIDPVSNQMLYSTGIVGISGASPGDTSTPYWDGNMRIYGPDYHSTVGVNNRMRYSADRPISISVMATAVVDHYFTLWYRINGGSWAALASSIEPGPADGFATVFWTSNFQLASNIYLDFAVSGSNTSGGFFDFGKRYLTNLNFNVSVVNV